MRGARSGRVLACHIVGMLVATAMVGAATAESAGPSDEFLRRANQWLQSTEAQKRKAAFVSFLQLGREAMPAYDRALDNARRYHTARLGQLVETGSANPFAAHAEAARQLDEERSRVLAMIHTDWEKNPEKIRELKRELDALATLHKRVRRLAASDFSSFDRQFDGTVGALADIARERLRFHPDDSLARLDDEKMRQQIMGEIPAAAQIIADRKRLQTSREETTRLEQVTRANADAGRWASGAVKSFALQLNSQRDVLGLTPLRLEEKLSAAAAGHSADMVNQHFFAHESPVEGKRTFVERTRLAGFQGNPAGENIFMGSPAPAAAFEGWFGSDGHRFLMFGKGTDVLGVGVAGDHWTMLTGNR